MQKAPLHHAKKVRAAAAPPPARDTLPAGELARLAQGWLLDGQIDQHSPQTQGWRRSLVRRFLWFLAQEGRPHCGPAEARAFLAYVNDGHAGEGGRWGQAAGSAAATRPPRPSTVRTYYGHLHAFFAWCVEQGRLDVSPLARVKAPTVRQDQVQPFSGGQIEALLAAARRSPYPRRDEALLLLLFDTGLRASEACGLTWADVDPLALELRVLGKGNKWRSVPFGRRCARALRLHREDGRGAAEGAAAEGPLWRTHRGAAHGQALTRYGLAQLVERLGADAGVRGVRCSPHTLRHTFAVTFLRSGGAEMTLMRILGHTSLAQTARYVKLASADVAGQHRIHSPADNLGRSDQGRPSQGGLGQGRRGHAG